ncbi:MAG: hypothetical protein Q4B06_03840 [Candidatus Saccharibacteria bacterium]|nr:hypothetical protein [Candidatus Saccharibacteria bacterium]
MFALIKRLFTEPEVQQPFPATTQRLVYSGDVLILCPDTMYAIIMDILKEAKAALDPPQVKKITVMRALKVEDEALYDSFTKKLFSIALFRCNLPITSCGKPDKTEIGVFTFRVDFCKPSKQH